MVLPPGLDAEGKNKKVCRLRKSLYGLKQSPRAWFDHFTKTILQQGYRQAHIDHTMFYRWSNEKTTILTVYVDDIVLTGNDLEELERVTRSLASAFEMNDLGMLRYFLGMEVARNKFGIAVSQQKYVLDLLKETKMIGCKLVDTPIDPSVKFGLEAESVPVDRGRYQRLVGKLIYLCHTRPDISFAVNCVSQFMWSPKESHLEAVHRIFKYLKGTPDKGLFFKKTEAKGVEVYVDADWAGSISD